MRIVKEIDFWKQVLLEIEDDDFVYFFLCDRSKTFKSAYKSSKKNVKYLRKKAKEFLESSDKWGLKFCVGQKSSLFVQQSSAASPDTKKVRIEFIRWMIYHLQEKRHESTINNI